MFFRSNKIFIYIYKYVNILCLFIQHTNKSTAFDARPSHRVFFVVLFGPPAVFKFAAWKKKKKRELLVLQSSFNWMAVDEM